MEFCRTYEIEWQAGYVCEAWHSKFLSAVYSYRKYGRHQKPLLIDRSLLWNSALCKGIKFTIFISRLYSQTTPVYNVSVWRVCLERLPTKPSLLICPDNKITYLTREKLLRHQKAELIHATKRRVVIVRSWDNRETHNLLSTVVRGFTNAFVCCIRNPQ